MQTIMTKFTVLDWLLHHSPGRGGLASTNQHDICLCVCCRHACIRMTCQTCSLLNINCISCRLAWYLCCHGYVSLTTLDIPLMNDPKSGTHRTSFQWPYPFLNNTASKYLGPFKPTADLDWLLPVA